MHNKDLHILFVSSWFPSSKLPFNGNFVIRHAEALAQYAKVSSAKKFKFVRISSLIDKHKNITGLINIIESFAAVIPFINTDIRPSLILINSERGFCVEKGNEQKFLEVILEFMAGNKKLTPKKLENLQLLF